MKLIRWGAAGKEKTGVILNDKRYDTSAFGEDYNEAFFDNDGLTRLAKFVSDNEGSLTEIADGERWGSPLGRPSKLICIGLNYADHAKETGATPPAEPVIFMKATSAIIGPFDDVIIPRDAKKVDWEVELAVVIGKKASYVEEAEALEYVAGYTLHNDISEREFQLERGGTWDKGKGCDTFAPIGPFMATADEIPDSGNLKLWLSVNGKMMQNGTTANFIFNVPFVIAYVSKFMTLLPGDVITTGTPAGVAMGMTPQAYLQAGDVMELGIEGLGVSKQTVKAYSK
ncbi:fumarylacetoacetate hydrolase family protein [Mucilaginibacter auburnensis]|uniref:2-keto-4-pentenoate hydratase/2-oxohepta-3-ene-1,7-dioic acid hydratase in catechol pathway n=1 Tax=Mucilaginibacter auburnensis TaxID=1457233 RepID=A0A2H9VP32_9SPHI|nr:fumarylacetoacetate hydrolase family protein [Mucilaginibacter auburnensis]PJJ80086.1 2-keto-4-pentenoate hydratase/2-oxohepta-3-ene-1,7-dioic acid hydratase in catechol pathway [Mucilaginibacter auburnensis]